MRFKTKYSVLLMVLILIILTAYSFRVGSTWAYDDLFLIGYMLLFYYFYNTVNPRWWVTMAFLLGIAFHSLGNFGIYTMVFWGYPYDRYTHLLVSLTVAMLIWEFISNKTNISLEKKVFFVVFTVAGMATIIEIFEFIGIRTLGPGEGMLFAGIEDLNPLDTIADLINNLIGALWGSLVMFVGNKFG